MQICLKQFLCPMHVSGSRYVFNATPDCEAIHGALYSCLRALFGLSVIGILVCIFCCMLVYQLLRCVCVVYMCSVSVFDD